MKILLIGEYSRLHNSLKEGLTHLGHEVILMGNGDAFKKYPVDINISHSFNSFFLKKLKSAIYKVFKIDLGSIEVYYKSKIAISKLPKIDIVQLINESSFKAQPRHEIRLLKKTLYLCKNIFLLSCGTDYYCMSYMINNIPKYSLLTPYLKDSSLKNKYLFQLLYLSKTHKHLHDFIYNNCKGIIASDFDYHLPLLKTKKYLGLIPNPINTDILQYEPLLITDKIIIFHGVNKNAVHKKGNHYFFEALDNIVKKYSDKIDIITVESVPYKEYITSYNKAHILLDQVYGYDQGYNALEAMAKGKVVFTGAEQEWLDHFNLEENTVAINALPDSNDIAKKLEWLILNPKKIIEISKNARQFIEKEHNYITIAEKYIKTWTNS